jgi:predicted PhzF superfamily epimerase YddE/YHI9
MGRPSEIHISIAASDGHISDVRIGGQAVLVAEGTLQLDIVGGHRPPLQ